MSGLTLAALLAADAGGYGAAAAAWQQLATRVDDAAEQLIRGTRELEDAWPLGPASQAAHDKTARLRAEVSNTYNPARRVGQALREHADALPGLQQNARSIIDEAAAAGIAVDAATGTVTAPASMYQTSAPHTVAQTVNAYVHQLSGVLTAAAELDARTANAINANLPDPATGFGGLSLRPVSKEDLEAQKGRSPAEVAAWWNSLTPEQQEQAIADHPQLVGWLDGVPATDRDVANRIVLDRRVNELQTTEDAYRRRIAELEAMRPDPYSPEANELYQLRQEVAAIDKEQAKVDSVQRALDKLGDKGLLLGFDAEPGRDGRAIVAVGNPDTAKHTAVWVPGLGTEMDDTAGNVNRVKNLQEAADGLTPEPNDVATVMWLGYDAPELDSVVGSGRSEQGGPLLDRYVDGLRATHTGGPQHVTVAGHSYGSTVVAEAALRGDGLAADDIVTAGSPGMHTNRAEDLQIDPRHVWAGSADGDHVSGAGGSVWGVHDNEPSDGDFGANRYATDTEGHSAYWTPGTESLLNQARVVVGQYGAVTLEHGSAPQ
jgi:pimeloyl-ACP methyl ester carboxylesterase